MYPVLCCESFSLHGPRLQTELWVSRKVCVQLCICKQQRRKHLSALSVLPKDHHLIVFVCTANRVSVTIKETRPQIPRWVKRSSVASKSTLNTLKLHLTRCSSTCSPLSSELQRMTLIWQRLCYERWLTGLKCTGNDVRHMPRPSQ